jgi:uncharacterized protein (UPF0210 family)
MRVRAITLGLPGHPATESAKSGAATLAKISEHFDQAGISVQSRRLCFSRWDRGFSSLNPHERKSELLELSQICQSVEIDFCSVGILSSPGNIYELPEVLVASTRLSAVTEVASGRAGVNNEILAATARCILDIGAHTDKGIGNFRFGAASCVEPGTPFFPAAYHDGESPAFSIGLESGCFLAEAFDSARSLVDAQCALQSISDRSYTRVAEIACSAAVDLDLRYLGLDTSIAPGINEQDSVVYGIERLGIDFGGPGSLATCAMITETVRRAPVKQIGYRGLMLPPLEDVVLARRVDEGRIRFFDLLGYSAVCGVGLDMIPLPGDTDSLTLERLIADVASLACRLRKPLLARLLPIPGTARRGVTKFDLPYLCDMRVLSV